MSLCFEHNYAWLCQVMAYYMESHLSHGCSQTTIMEAGDGSDKTLCILNKSKILTGHVCFYQFHW